MKLVFRMLALLLVVSLTYHFFYWVPFSLIPVYSLPWIVPLISMICSVLVGWYVWSWSRSIPDDLPQCFFFGAFIVGGFGFAAGFFGPIIFLPGANQGPLLGIFITGPLGFLLGGIGGFVYWLVKRRKTERIAPV